MGISVAVTATLPYLELDLALRTVEELHLTPKTKLGVDLLLLVSSLIIFSGLPILIFT